VKLDGATIVGGYSEDSGQLLSNCSREFAVNSDAAYYALRAREERTAAMHSSHPNVRRVHLEFADAYEARIVAIGAKAKPLARSSIDKSDTARLEMPIILRQ